MNIIAIDRTAPFYDPRGWMQWPGNEDFSFQFMRVLGAAQDGGSTVSECLLAASGIDPNHEESWYRQWKKAVSKSLDWVDEDAHLLTGTAGEG